MTWSSLGPFPSFSKFKIDSSLIENVMELHWAISYIFSKKFISDLMENDLELNWAISFVF